MALIITFVAIFLISFIPALRWTFPLALIIGFIAIGLAPVSIIIAVLWVIRLMFFRVPEKRSRSTRRSRRLAYQDRRASL